MKNWILTLSWLFMMDAQGIPIESTRSLRQQVDSYADLLQKDVAKEKNAKKKIRATKRVLGQIKALRENSAPQGPLDEAHMDLLVSVLESLPNESQFRKKNCQKYEMEFINQYEPTAEEAPQEPAVRPGWTVLQSLCQ